MPEKTAAELKKEIAQLESRLKALSEREHAERQHDSAIAALNVARAIRGYYASSKAGHDLIMQIANTVRNSGGTGFAAAVALMVAYAPPASRAAKLREIADKIDGKGELPELH